MTNHLLRTARLQRGWTQLQLADFAMISLSSVERAERGEMMRVDTMNRLSECLHKSPEQLGLLKGYTEKSNPTMLLINENAEQVYDGNVLSLPLPPPTSSYTLISGDIPTWFSTRVNDIKTIGTFLDGSRLSFQHHQALVHAEIEKWKYMTNNQDYEQEYQITRRMALATLALLPSALLNKMRAGPFPSIIVEEFLAESTTSIVACWHLLRGNGLPTVEQALPRYLPVLVALMKEYPSYSERAAYLASQGFLLFSLVALHQLHFAERVAYCQQSVHFAKESGDRDLFVASLMHLGDAFFTNGQKTEMLNIYSLAEQQSKQAGISNFLRSKVQAELAHAYAQHGKDQEALRSIEKATLLFTEEDAHTPVYISTDYGRFQLILFEGLCNLDLGRSQEIQGQETRAHAYYQNASQQLRQIDQLEESILVPERIRVEITNQQAFAAVKEGHLDEFVLFLQEGLKGAKVLASEKRRQEAISAWRVARERWPQEKQIEDLADIFL